MFYTPPTSYHSFLLKQNLSSLNHSDGQPVSQPASYNVAKTSSLFGPFLHDDLNNEENKHGHFFCIGEGIE